MSGLGTGLCSGFLPTVDLHRRGEGVPTAVCLESTQKPSTTTVHSALCSVGTPVQAKGCQRGINCFLVTTRPPKGQPQHGSILYPKAARATLNQQF